nr:BTAD domain-containing putative transcriptional regulator [Kibdelosporangium sp. MJ126-NF4]
MLSYQLLGPLRVLRDDAEIRLGAPQARAVLALLLMASGEVVPRDRIADELWGDDPPASSKVQIQGLISHLRRVLDGETIVTRGAGYLLDVTQRDDLLFGRLIAEGHELIDDGQLETGARKLRSALDLWRGPYLADIDIPAARSNAVQLTESHLSATEDRIAVDLELGRCAHVVPELTDLIDEHPFRERLRGQLMTALARSGRIAEALKAYDTWRHLLSEELGVQPSPALRALHGGILRAEPGLRPASYSAYRPGVPRQLPPDIPDFVGRQDVLDAGLRRILVVTGPSGIGKTALAIRLAHQVKNRFPDGQLFVSLRATSRAPLTPVAVLGRFLRALGVPADMVPTEVDTCAGLFQDMVSGRRMLVVLDDAMDEHQIQPLVPDDPGCAAIVTSRRTMPGLDSTQLAGLPVDDMSTLLSCLLPGSAGRGRVTADELTELHTQCAGSPLAIRIVGGRLADRPQWTARNVARSLAAERDRLPARDRAVRSSFVLSYRELGQRAKQLFCALGALGDTDFAGWVATALLDDGPTGGDVRPLLDELVCRHMVQRIGPDRYRLHDLLRSLAVDSSTAMPRAAIERVLGGWLWLAETAADRLPPNVLRPEPGTARRWPVPDGARDGVTSDPLAWFDAEHPALEAAIALAVDLGMGEFAWELASVCATYFEHRGLFDDWLRCCLLALPAARKAGPEIGPSRGVAALLRNIGQVHIFRDNYPQAAAAVTESFEISERIGDRPGMARGLAGRGIVARELDQFDDAMRYYQRALAIFTELADLHGAIQVRNNIAALRIVRGQLDDAQACLDESLRDCVVLGEDHRTASVLRVYGRLCLHRDDAPSAVGYLGQALEIVDAMRDERCTAHVRLLLGRAHAMLGDYEAARNALRTASVQFVETGNGRSEATCARLLGELFPAHDRL